MYMQYLKNKIIILSVFISVGFFNSSIFAQQTQRAGSLVGTIAYVREDNRSFVDFSPDTTIFLIHNKSEITIVSDQNGDYIVEFPIGRYCIRSIEKSDGTEQKISSAQHMCFRIRKDKTTRFDISLVEQ